MQTILIDRQLWFGSSLLAVLQSMHSPTIWVQSVEFQFLSEVKKVLMNHVWQKDVWDCGWIQALEYLNLSL